MGRISWWIKWAHAGAHAESFQRAMGQLYFIDGSDTLASKTNASILQSATYKLGGPARQSRAAANRTADGPM